MRGLKLILEKLYRCVMGGSILVLGVFIGCYLTQSKIQKDTQKLTINMIAVVNMDEGITVGGEYINYASALIRYPDVNFISTGLEEARQGVENGNYAAYILIPAGFSKNVMSLNTIPDSASVEYAVNPNLRSDIYSEVMEDISLFTGNLNDNIEYMYLTSILKEFHRAQDVALQIMENDTADMELLLAIDHEEITHRIELSPVEMPEYALTSLDLSVYYRNIESLSADIAELYENYENNGEQAFAEIAQSGDDVSNSLGIVGTMMKNADFSTDAAGNDILLSGVQAVNQYVTDVIAQNAETISRIQTGIAAYQSMTEEEVAQAVEAEVAQALCGEVNRYHGNMMTQIELKLEEVDRIVGELSQPALLTEDDYERLQSELASVMTEIDVLRENTFVLDTTNISTVAGQVATDLTSGMRTILDDMNTYRYPDADEIGTLVMESVLIPLQDNRDRIAGEISSAVVDVSSDMAAYQNSVEQFNLYDYVNEGEIDGLVAQVQQDFSMMQTQIYTQDSTYRELLYEIYKKENENLQNWRNDIQEADAISAQKLEEGLARAKESRSNSNCQNVELLFELTQKLPYTRLGSMEYTNAYEFIVAPIGTMNVGEKQQITMFYMNREYELYAIGLLIFISCILLIRLGYRACRGRGNARISEKQSSMI